MSKTIGIFGGSFDPVHTGHSKIILDIKKTFVFKKILIIPSGRPVIKESHFADSVSREKMLEIAFNKIKGTSIDKREILKKKVSYTYETLEELHKEYKDNQHFSFILGQDAFEDFKKWKNWKKILDLCSLIVAKRPNYSFSESYLNEFKNYITSSPTDFLEGHGKIFFTDNTLLDVSSSYIRKSVYKPEFKKSTMDLEVIDYIKKNLLYKD